MARNQLPQAWLLLLKYELLLWQSCLLEFSKIGSCQVGCRLEYCRFLCGLETLWRVECLLYSGIPLSLSNALKCGSELRLDVDYFQLCWWVQRCSLENKRSINKAKYFTYNGVSVDFFTPDSRSATQEHDFVSWPSWSWEIYVLPPSGSQKYWVETRNLRNKRIQSVYNWGVAQREGIK